MGAWLSLPVAAALDELPAGPGLCETCRSRPAAAAGYCGPLCALFDAALDELTAARIAAPDDPAAPAVVAARTKLRAVAYLFDARDVHRGGAQAAAAEWAADVAAGLLLPVPFALAVARVRELLAVSA